MKTFLINASLPGCGKSYLLTKIFKNYKLHQNEHAIYICKTNKALDNAKAMLNGERLDKYKSFKTLDQFLENWKIISTDNDGGERLVHLNATSHISRTYWSIFIDEISMLSDTDIKEITENFRVANIIAAGDTSQHKPIKDIYYEKSVSGLIKHINSDTPTPNTFWNKTYILNEPFRFKDQKLIDFLDVLKQRDIVTEGFIERLNFPDCYRQDSNDIHICYTNKEADETNEAYSEKELCSRWVLNRKWKFDLTEQLKMTLQNGQFVDEDFYSKVLEAEKNLFSPAMAITSHKLQGWTAQPGHRIFIHLGDFDCSNIEDPIERSLAFMRSLWVALTRAPRLSQVNIIGCTKSEAVHLINKHITSNWYQTLNGVNISQDDAYNDIMAELEKTVEDKTDPRFVEWLKDYGKAHSVQHKQHKQHKCNTFDSLDVEAVKKMKADGASIRTIAKIFGVSTTTINKALK